MTSLTIIIPLLSDTETDLFETTLVSVLENRPEEDDILVVNAAGYENRYDLTQEEGVIFCDADPDCGLIDALNIGVENSETPYICPILCGCEVEEGWAEPALTRMAEDGAALVIPQMRKIAPSGREIHSFGYTMQRDGILLPLRSPKPPAGAIPAPALGAAFFRREEVLALGLFQPALGPMAFADVAMLMDELDLGIVYEPRSVLTYPAEAVPALNRTARLTAQEALFLRWSPVWKKRARSHGWRLFKEKLFGGAAVRQAYAQAREKIDAPRPEQILAEAHAAAR